MLKTLNPFLLEQNIQPTIGIKVGITVGIVIIVVILFITYWKFDKICRCLKKTENFRESNEIESFRSRFKDTFDSSPPPLEIVQDFKTNEGNLRNRKKSEKTLEDRNSFLKKIDATNDSENCRESNEIESFRSRFKNTFDSAPPPLEIVQDFKTNEGNLRNRKKSVVFEKKSKNNVPKIQSKSKSDDVQYDFQFHYINEDVLEVVRQIYSLSLHILDC